MPNSLLIHLRKVAPDTANIPILQPADPFLETAGEDLRRRIFLTEAADGGLNCLRPEFTIPICLTHKNGAGRYAYGGTVFRQNRVGGNEFYQAGLEDLGDSNSVQADTCCIVDMVHCLNLLDIQQFQFTLGDQTLFQVVVENLKLPSAVASRLVRNFGEPAQIDRVIDQLTSPRNGTAIKDEAHGLAAKGDEIALIAHVETLMKNANLAANSGRSAADIARRMIEKVQEAQFRLGAEQAAILRQFLALETPLAESTEALANFASEAGLDFGAHLSNFGERIAMVKGEGIALDNFTYKASFGRKLDYYTGLLFDVEVSGTSIAGGGRYDRLCTLLGHAQPVPAVGFSIYMDRVGEVAR